MTSKFSEPYLNLFEEVLSEEVFSSTDTVTKDKVLTFRLEPGLYNLLEALTESWKTGTVSNTARTILSMHFLPVVYEYEWRNLVPEKLAEWKQEQQETGFSVKLARFHKFLYELSEYLKFLNEAEERGAGSLGFIGDKKQQVQEAINKLAEMELSLKELTLQENEKNVK